MISSQAMFAAAPNRYAFSEQQLCHLQAWFTGYVGSFYTAHPALQSELTLKEQHSYRVSKEIKLFGNQLNLGGDDLRIADVMGLLHDIGRFEQVARYRTFVDGKSEDHAELGVKVLQREKVLATLEEETQQLILRAIAYHNRLSLPEDESPSCLFYSRLLRDADKTDILALFATYYHLAEAERSAVVELNLPDRPDVSAEILEDLRQGRTVKMQDLKCLNDFKLLQLGWVYDIHFPPTFAALRERGYLQKIRASLPASAELDQIYSQLLSYIGDKAPFNG